MKPIAHSIKTAISFPAEDYREVERLRKETGKTRSQILLEAFRLWRKQLQESALEKRYADGYRQYPEAVHDDDSLLKASLQTWDEKETW